MRVTATNVIEEKAWSFKYDILPHLSFLRLRITLCFLSIPGHNLTIQKKLSVTWKRCFSIAFFLTYFKCMLVAISWVGQAQAINNCQSTPAPSHSPFQLLYQSFLIFNSLSSLFNLYIVTVLGAFEYFWSLTHYPPIFVLYRCYFCIFGPVGLFTFNLF